MFLFFLPTFFLFFLIIFVLFFNVLICLWFTKCFFFFSFLHYFLLFCKKKKSEFFASLFSVVKFPESFRLFYFLHHRFFSCMYWTNLPDLHADIWTRFCLLQRGCSEVCLRRSASLNAQVVSLVLFCLFHICVFALFQIFRQAVRCRSTDTSLILERCKCSLYLNQTGNVSSDRCCVARFYLSVNI